MKTRFLGISFIAACLLMPASKSAWASHELLSKNGTGIIRSFKNILGAPLEIPSTIRNYHQGSGRPVIRETAGFFDGATRMVAREFNGILDLFMSFLPGEQDGLPMQPETLF